MENKNGNYSFIYGLGFRVKGQGDLGRRFIRGVAKVTLWVIGSLTCKAPPKTLQAEFIHADSEVHGCPRGCSHASLQHALNLRVQGLGRFHATRGL